jgi:hypothetical protein
MTEPTEETLNAIRQKVLESKAALEESQVLLNAIDIKGLHTATDQVMAEAKTALEKASEALDRIKQTK